MDNLIRRWARPVCLSIFLFSSAMGTAQAQRLMREDPLSRAIIISHYKQDAAKGEQVLVDRWSWLDYAGYYRMTTLLLTAPVVPVAQISDPESADQKITVSETSPNGNMLRFMSLYDGKITQTNFVYAATYYDDVLEFAKTLREKIRSEGQRQAPDSKAIEPALLTFTLQTKEGLTVWTTNKKEDVEAVRTVLKKSPELGGMDLIGNNNNFDGSGAIHLIVDPSLTDMPQQVDFDKYQIRATRITPNTHTYFDKGHVWDYAIGQKTLAEKYKSLGIQTPPKTY